MQRRRRFTDEFKRQSVVQATKAGNTVAGIARDIGVERSVLAGWVRKMNDGTYEPTPDKPIRSASHVELEQLRRELAKVKMERDILKKALGYFAKDPM